ncbi:MAG TPA: hypothetical protein VHI98_29465 [Vicinamibacterales bacterium]|nr:hypothetical protein [Vicinamibacterales bacterium]
MVGCPAFTRRKSTPRDAQDKAAIITEPVERLGARADETIDLGYVEL